MKNITLYAYLNIDNPMVAWEVAIGRIRSACDLGMDHSGFGISLWQYNLLHSYKTNGRSNRFVNELKLEKIRQTKFPHQVSRIRGAYFFESEADAHTAVDRWKIPAKKKYISKINFSASHLTKVDSEWITSYLASNESEWMTRYWKGETLGTVPLTEVLASGIGAIDNIDLRREAYTRIIRKQPDSTPLLAIASCAFKYAHIESVAQIIPGILKTPEGINVNFYIYMKDLEERESEIINAIKICIENDEFPPAIKPKEPDAFFRLPDLRKGEFLFSDPGILNLYEEIHESIRE